jgi:hypothetical protein
MYFWAKEAPKTIVDEVSAPKAVVAPGSGIITTTANPSTETSYKISSRADQVFRVMVLKVWKAYCSPRAQQDKLLREETIEQTYSREMWMRARRMLIIYALLLVNTVIILYFI